MYLNVGPTGGRSWLFRYMLDGHAHEMGLGPYPTFGLKDARQRAAVVRKLRHDGIDPLAKRNAERQARRLAAASAITFKDCTGKYIAANRAGWRNAKHAGQWEATLAAYAYPVIGKLSVVDVDTGHVTRILEPIWTTKTETAGRVLGRIESVLDFAKAKGWRAGENPARWRGHLENVLPKRSKVRNVEHHPALPWKEIGAFMAELDKQDGIAVPVLRFTILTAARTGEVINARWSEIDMQAAVWTVPGDRTKAGKEQRVPRAEAALAVLREAAKLREGDNPFVFPGRLKGKPLSDTAMLVVLRQMERGDLTVHGFRSSFRDWAAETGQPADLAEATLAHAAGDKTVVAYQRGDVLERRRKLMAAWAAFCARVVPAGGNVVAIRQPAEVV